MITAASNNIGDIRSDRKRNKKNRNQKWEEKQLYGDFKRQIAEIALKKTSILLQKENLKRDTKSFLITTQNKQNKITNN